MEFSGKGLSDRKFYSINTIKRSFVDFSNIHGSILPIYNLFPSIKHSYFVSLTKEKLCVCIYNLRVSQMHNNCFVPTQYIMVGTFLLNLSCGSLFYNIKISYTQGDCKFVFRKRQRLSMNRIIFYKTIHPMYCCRF